MELYGPWGFLPDMDNKTSPNCKSTLQRMAAKKSEEIRHRVTRKELTSTALACNSPMVVRTTRKDTALHKYWIPTRQAHFNGIGMMYHTMI
jgi:hypothetical protein